MANWRTAFTMALASELTATIAVPAWAVSLPEWDITQICHKDKALADCTIPELQARSALSGRSGQFCRPERRNVPNPVYAR